MMFSATLSPKVKEVCKMFMKDPFEIYIDGDKNLTLHGLKQFYVKLEENQKIKKLIQLLDDLEFNQVIIFTNQQAYAQKLNEIIQKEKFPSVACYRSMEQEQRIQTYTDFKKGKYRSMVTTDLMGRGIDIEKINIVINYDMPNDSD
jgi:superfamily II DNA/RNA helicase